MITVEAPEKYVRQSISFPPDLLEAVKRLAGDNVSGYIRGLVMADLERKTPLPDPVSPNVIEDLTRVLLGSLKSEQVATMIKGGNQPEILARLLDELVTFLSTNKTGDKFHLVNAEQVMSLAWERVSERVAPGDAAAFLAAFEAEIQALRSPPRESIHLPKDFTQMRNPNASS